MKIQLGDDWTDDHLPCFAVTIDGKHYEVCWTGQDVYGRLELVEDGDISLEKALKKYPELLAVLNGTTKVESEEGDDGDQVWYTDGGCVSLKKD